MRIYLRLLVAFLLLSAGNVVYAEAQQEKRVTGTVTVIPVVTSTSSLAPAIGIDTLSIDRNGKAVGRVCFFSCSSCLNFCQEASVPSLAQLS